MRFNPLKPNDAYICRTTPLTSRRCILYIYSTNIRTEYFKHAANSPFFPLQNAVYFIILHCLVPVLYAFYIQDVLKFKCKIQAPRSRIFSTFGTTRVVGRQPKVLAAFTPGEIPDTHFQRLSRPQDTWFYRKEPRKISQVTSPGIDPGTVRLVAQRLNHYATPGPSLKVETLNTKK